MRPNSVGPKILYFNPGTAVAFNTTELAAIDSSLANAPENLYPYAYTATVRDDYDAMNFGTAAYSTSDLVGNRNVAWGVFLSADISKKNLLFQLSGQIDVSSNVAITDHLVGGFFFGRTVASTVTSTKAAQANQLAKGIWVPPTSVVALPSVTLQPRMLSFGIVEELFSYELSTGYVYCFGFYLQTLNATTATLSLKGSLAMRKYESELSAFRPSR